MAPRTHTPTTALAKLAVLSFHARRIGLEILRLDRRDITADFRAVTPQVQDEYEQLGTIVALQNDPIAMRPALYAAADALVINGIGSLSPAQRASAIALFARGLQAMKKHLAGVSNPDHADLMRALVECDKAAGIDQQLVTASKDVAFDLKNAEPISAEVM